MKTLFSLVALCFSFFLIAFGGFLFLISFHPEWLIALESRLWVFSRLGVGIVLLALILLFVFWRLTRKRYLLLEMGGVSLQEEVLQEIVEEIFSATFGPDAFLCEVVIHKKGKVEILADLPYLLDKKRETLRSLEQQIAAKFEQVCGIKETFLFNVSFRKDLPSQAT